MVKSKKLCNTIPMEETNLAINTKLIRNLFLQKTIFVLCKIDLHNKLVLSEDRMSDENESVKKHKWACLLS